MSTDSQSVHFRVKFELRISKSEANPNTECRKLETNGDLNRLACAQLRART
jgi:hypothetical protein